MENRYFWDFFQKQLEFFSMQFFHASIISESGLKGGRSPRVAIWPFFETIFNEINCLYVEQLVNTL